VNAHEVKPVRLIQSLCAVCGSNLAGLTLLYIVLPCVAAVVFRLVADVNIVNCAVCQQFNKRTLLLLFIIDAFVRNDFISCSICMMKKPGKINNPEL